MGCGSSIHTTNQGEEPVISHSQQHSNIRPVAEVKPHRQDNSSDLSKPTSDSPNRETDTADTHDVDDTDGHIGEDEDSEMGQCYFVRVTDLHLKIFGLSPLTIPEVDVTRKMQDYTIDDLAKDKSLFKYGRKVYSIDIMLPIIKERVREFAKIGWVYYRRYKTHPVHEVEKKITTTEMRKLLPVCQVGKFVELPTYIYLSRMENDVKQIIDDKQNDNVTLEDYKRQLSRWIQKYPNVEIENKLPHYNTDPNEMTFPIKIYNPAEFQKWLTDWEVFDTEVPESGAWRSYEHAPIQDPDLPKQAHKVYALAVQYHDDELLKPFDMTIDGEAGWSVIQQDIVKHDITTEAQLKTWSLRERRRNIDDPSWMAKRRQTLADRFVQTYNKDAEWLMPYLSFVDNLEHGWKEFETLCDNPYNPPERYRMLYDTFRGDTNNIDIRR